MLGQYVFNLLHFATMYHSFSLALTLAPCPFYRGGWLLYYVRTGLIVVKVRFSVKTVMRTPGLCKGRCLLTLSRLRTLKSEVIEFFAGLQPAKNSITSLGERRRREERQLLQSLVSP